MKHKLYPEMLGEIFKDYSGEYENILKWIPPFFNLLQKVYNNDLDWKSKFKINCCFSYFAIPQDVISDDLGPKGYLDDLFVCSFVIGELLPYHAELLLNKWDFEEDLESLIERILLELESLLKEKTSDILNFTGLSRFNKIIEDSHTREFKNDIEDRMSMIKLEILDLIGLLRMIIMKEGGSHSKKLNKLSELTKLRIRLLRDCFDEEEWKGVIKLLEKIEIHESCFDNSSESLKEEGRKNLIAEMEKIRRKVILNIDEALFED